MKNVKINLSEMDIDELKDLELQIEGMHEDKFGKLPDEWVVFIERKSPRYGAMGRDGARGFRKARTFIELIATDSDEIVMEIKEGIVNLNFYDHDGVNYGKLTSSDDLNAEGYDLEDKCSDLIYSEKELPFIEF